MQESNEGQTISSRGGLPIVSEATIKGIWDNYTSKESWGQHLEEVKARLIKDNPQLAKFVESQVSKYPPQLHNAMFEVVVSTLAVLEHQAQADKLSSMFRASDTTE